VSPLLVRPATIQDATVIAEFQVAMALETENKILDPAIVHRAVEKVFADSSKGFYLVVQSVADDLSNDAALVPTPAIDPDQATDQATGVVASLLVTYEWSDWRDSNMWYIQSVFVRQAFRRQGCFRKMYAQVIEMAQQQAVMFVRLYVETDNVAAQGVYQSIGMKRLPYFMYQADL